MWDDFGDGGTDVRDEGEDNEEEEEEEKVAAADEIVPSTSVLVGSGLFDDKGEVRDEREVGRREEWEEVRDDEEGGEDEVTEEELDEEDVEAL